MAHLNKVFLLGNLTRDPERRTLPSGTPLTDLRLAVSRKYKLQSGEDREETLFISVTVFGKMADTAAKYMQKGKPVLIEGRLRLEEWQGKDGQKQSRISVIADNFQLLGGGGDRSARSSEMGDAPADAMRRPAPAPADGGGDEGAGESAEAPEGVKDDDNLPF